MQSSLHHITYNITHQCEQINVAPAPRPLFARTRLVIDMFSRRWVARCYSKNILLALRSERTRTHVQFTQSSVWRCWTPSEQARIVLVHMRAIERASVSESCSNNNNNGSATRIRNGFGGAQSSRVMGLRQRRMRKRCERRWCGNKWSPLLGLMSVPIQSLRVWLHGSVWLRSQK